MEKRGKYHQLRVSTKGSSHATAAEKSTRVKEVTSFRGSVPGRLNLIVRALGGMAAMLRPS
jgi:hypothetical protein